MQWRVECHVSTVGVCIVNKPGVHLPQPDCDSLTLVSTGQKACSYEIFLYTSGFIFPFVHFGAFHDRLQSGYEDTHGPTSL